MIQLLQRFYDPDRGRVTIDGIDLRDMARADFRRAIALVPQDQWSSPQARENIRFGRPDATDAEVEAAARARRRPRFPERPARGLRQLCRRNAASCCRAARKQRIAIARAILRDAPILLWTRRHRAGRRKRGRGAKGGRGDGAGPYDPDRRAPAGDGEEADRIVVFDQGRIVAQGTHDSLVAEGGLYAASPGFSSPRPVGP